MAEEPAPIDHADELVRLKVLELRRSAESQTDLILEMKSVGFVNSRIADLLDTTTDTVGASIRQANKRKKNER